MDGYCMSLFIQHNWLVNKYQFPSLLWQTCELSPILCLGYLFCISARLLGR